MGKFSEYIGSQFGNPRGFVGKCCCLIMNVMNKAMYKNVVKQMQVEKQSKALDIGYGNGYLVQQIYKKFECELFGIDISEDMKKDAIKRNQKVIEDGKIQLLVGDCCFLNFGNDFFQAVTSINTIYFWSDTLKGLTEINRVLKQGGSFYNVVYAKKWLKKLSYTQTGFRFFEKEELITLGKEAGFSNVQVRDIVNGKSFIVQYDK